MRSKSIVSLLVLLLFVSSLAIAQSRETGAIVGSVQDEENTPLPGVTVTLSGPKLMGIRTVITDEKGEFRFPALPPGVYSVEAKLAGFATVVRENIRLTTTVRLTVDFTLKIAAVEEEVTVIAISPTVDVKSTETASITLTDEVLRNIPYSQFTADLVNLAPGVIDDVAYGASSGTGISYQLDGVDVSDPYYGTPWVFLDHNILEEAKVMGIGLPPEYGAFTGVIFNTVTKSGGNVFSGHFETLFQGKKDDWPKNFWQAANNDKYVDDFPEVTPPQFALYDFNAHVGGPILKDKLWFYAGAQYYREFDRPTGFPEDRDYKQPRGFLKLTAQVSGSTSFMSFFEYDAYNGTNRGGSATTSPDAVVGQDSPDYVGNFSLTHIFSSTTFMELKGSFFLGAFYLEPETGRNVNAHFDLNDNMLYYSSGYYYLTDRDRFQANASVTHYAEDFIQGDHDFKFGVEVEHGRVSVDSGYTGPNAWYYIDYVGYGPFGYYYTGNYLAYEYVGKIEKTNYVRFEGFAQDQWKVSDRFNISLGARFTQNWGTIPKVGTVYKNFRIAPRVGFTFDILGDKTTIFKAHYGQFTEAMYAYLHRRLNPDENYSDYVGYYWDVPSESWVEMFRSVHEQQYELADDIKHPYMDQITLSIEREVFQDASFSMSYIWRKWRNIIGRVDTGTDYATTTLYDPEDNTPYTLYYQTNPGNYHYIIKNIEQGDEGQILLDPYRKYWGLEFLFNKRFSNKWQLIASYVYGQATGTINNAGASDIGGYDTSDPNFWFNGEGNLTYDPTHMLKIQGTYVLPLGIYASAYVRAITGQAWAREVRDRLPSPDRRRVYYRTEPRGSEHYPLQKIVDVRLEKTFMISEKYRLGVMLDIFNLLNDDTIRSWGETWGYDWNPGDYPSTDGHELYSIVAPRKARVGLRFMW